jgi:hypothetical protein
MERSQLEPEFLAEVEAIAKRLNIRPGHLLTVMNQESGFDPAAVNREPRPNGKPPTYTTGLIQFSPDTAVGLGTTRDDLEKMTRVQQLPYVEKYLKDIMDRYGLRGMNLAQLYGSVFGGTPELSDKSSDGFNTKAQMLGKMKGDLESWGEDTTDLAAYESIAPKKGSSSSGVKKNRSVWDLYAEASDAFKGGGTVEEMTQKLLELTGGDAKKALAGLGAETNDVSDYEKWSEKYRGLF